jgi:hypothetical protein
MGIQEIRWDGEGYQRDDRHFPKENGILITNWERNFVHNRIISAVKMEEFLNDRMSYKNLNGRWCDNILPNVYAPIEDKDDDNG